MTPDDVIVAGGASGALELALTAILDDGTVLLGEWNQEGEREREGNSPPAGWYHRAGTNNGSIGKNEPRASLSLSLPLSCCPSLLLLPLPPSLSSAVPRPGFPLYQVIAESHGALVEHYDLLPDKGWECDLDHMERLLVASSSSSSRSSSGSTGRPSVRDDDDGGGDDGDRRPRRRREVRGILVNNPSNPTGAVYSREHLRRVVALAGRYRVPIIADEIYGDLTFGGRRFHPLADVAASMGSEVPIITASGLGKQCECVVPTFIFAPSAAFVAFLVPLARHAPFA